jgi:hypothetical protein
MKFLILSFLTLSSPIPTIFGYPNGAGSCDTGGAVGGEHLTNTPLTNGTLVDGSFQVVLDGTTSLAPGQATSIVPLQSYTLSIVPTAGNTFTGALIRIAGQGTFTLTPGINAQEAAVCTDPVFGVTHSESSDKTEFNATFVSDGAADYLVDVTVVEFNAASEGSQYYYSQYQLQATDAVTAPTASTTMNGPTAKPATMNGATPVVTPVVTPVATPMNYNVADDNVTSPAAAPVRSAPTTSAASSTLIAATSMLAVLVLSVVSIV